MDRKDIADIKFKFLYLVVLILDAIQTAVIIIVVIAALFAFHVVSGLLSFVCSASQTNNGTEQLNVAHVLVQFNVHR